MRACPGCAYLVPEAWSQCKRCGAALAETAAIAAGRGPAGAPVAVHAASAAATVLRAPAYQAASFTAPRNPATDLRPTERGAGRRLGAQERAVHPRRRFSITALVAVVVVAACGYVAWNRVAHPPVPTELRPWLSGAQGVTFAPDGAGFSVSLPAAPAVRSGRMTLGRPAVSLSPTLAETVVGQHIVGVVWFVAPHDALTDDSDGPLHAAAVAASRAAGFELDVVESTTHGGLQGIDAEVHRDAMQGDALVVLDGNRVVAAYVLGATNGGAGYDHLRHTLVLY